jgi:hypothetical protein
VDEIVRLWSKARPDLDPEPMAPIGRILRLARQFDRELAPVYRAKGLDFGLFDVLATLRRIGPPYRLTPGELDDWCNQPCAHARQRSPAPAAILFATGLTHGRRAGDETPARRLVVTALPRRLRGSPMPARSRRARRSTFTASLSLSMPR